MPPQGEYARYKQHVRNSLYIKHGWDRIAAIRWLNEHEQFVRQMMATEVHYRELAKIIDDMEKKVNANLN